MLRENYQFYSSIFFKRNYEIIARWKEISKLRRGILTIVHLRFKWHLASGPLYTLPWVALPSHTVSDEGPVAPVDSYSTGIPGTFASTACRKHQRGQTPTPQRTWRLMID